MAGRLDRADTMESTPEASSRTDNKQAEKSYLSAAVESMSNPWGGSRSTTPKPVPNTATPPGEASGLKNQHAGERTRDWHGLSLKRYPPDCPPMDARWFYAVDVSVLRNVLAGTTKIGRRLIGNGRSPNASLSC